jgi:hypothetical protein
MNLDGGSGLNVPGPSLDTNITEAGEPIFDPRNDL